MSAAGPREPILDIKGLSLTFSGARKRLAGRHSGARALVDISLKAYAGETLAVVGESGSGKSTLLRAIIGLTRYDHGSIAFRGRDLTNVGAGERKRFRRQVQLVFQDSYSALNPRMTVRKLLLEPLEVHDLHERQERLRRAHAFLELVGLRARDADRYPHEFSGGQRQRINIARALILEPEMLLLDEPVSALDVSTQAQIINLLKDLQRRLALTYVFVSHDLSVVDHFADELAVMYLGRVVETGRSESVLRAPRHPYTRALLSSVPVSHPDAQADGGRIVLHGELPDPSRPPIGCVFETRCWKRQDLCISDRPELVDDPHEVGRCVACHFPLETEPVRGQPQDEDSSSNEEEQ